MQHSWLSLFSKSCIPQEMPRSYCHLAIWMSFSLWALVQGTDGVVAKFLGREPEGIKDNIFQLVRSLRILDKQPSKTPPPEVGVAFLIQRVRNAFDDAAPLSSGFAQTDASETGYIRRERLHIFSAPVSLSAATQTRIKHQIRASVSRKLKSESPEPDELENKVYGVRVRMSMEAPRQMASKIQSGPRSLLDRIYFSNDAQSRARKRREISYFSSPLRGTESRDIEILGGMRSNAAAPLAVPTASHIGDVSEGRRKYTQKRETSQGLRTLSAQHVQSSNSPTTQFIITSTGTVTQDLPKATEVIAIERVPLYRKIFSQVLRWWSSPATGTLSTLRKPDEQLSRKDIDTLVDEIIHQVQLRTRDEFTEHVVFLERERNLSLRAAYPARRKGMTMREVLSGALVDSGLTDYSISRILEEVTKRFRVQTQ